jgi:dUTP pyrophosphatase
MFNEILPIRFKKLNLQAEMPTYASYGDAGADLYSTEFGILHPGERRLVGTGIAVEIPVNYVGLVHPRSGLAHKFGITVVNSPGTIDSGYRGEVKVNLINTSSSPYSFCMGDRIAQLIIQPVVKAVFQEVEELSDSVRGASGHGSTGGFNG